MYPSYNRQPGEVRYPGKENQITVIGEGKVTVHPDLAFITVGVVTENKSLQTAQSENSQASAKVIQALIKLGIARENIQTVEYRIENVFDYIEGRQVFRGYEVRHLLQVKVEAIKQIGLVVDTVIAQGANMIYNIRFDTAKRTEFYQEALKLSVGDAQKKAQTIAQTIGAHISSVPHKVTETARMTGPIPYAALKFEQVASTPIEPGTLEITAAISAEFVYV